MDHLTLNTLRALRGRLTAPTRPVTLADGRPGLELLTPLKIRGVSRDTADKRTLVVHADREVSDGEMREIQGVLSVLYDGTLCQ